MCGDFNEHVGRDSDGYEHVHREFGYDQKNVDGEKVLYFADSSKLKSANTWFKNNIGNV